MMPPKKQPQPRQQFQSQSQQSKSQPQSQPHYLSSTNATSAKSQSINTLTPRSRLQNASGTTTKSLQPTPTPSLPLSPPLPPCPPLPPRCILQILTLHTLLSPNSWKNIITFLQCLAWRVEGNVSSVEFSVLFQEYVKQVAATPSSSFSSLPPLVHFSSLVISNLLPSQTTSSSSLSTTLDLYIALLINTKTLPSNLNPTANNNVARITSLTTSLFFLLNPKSTGLLSYDDITVLVYLTMLENPAVLRGRGEWSRKVVCDVTRGLFDDVRRCDVNGDGEKGVDLSKNGSGSQSNGQSQAITLPAFTRYFVEVVDDVRVVANLIKRLKSVTNSTSNSHSSSLIELALSDSPSSPHTSSASEIPITPASPQAYLLNMVPYCKGCWECDWWVAGGLGKSEDDYYENDDDDDDDDEDETQQPIDIETIAYLLFKNYNTFTALPLPTTASSSFSSISQGTSEFNADELLRSPIFHKFYTFLVEYLKLWDGRYRFYADIAEGLLDEFDDDEEDEGDDDEGEANEKSRNRGGGHCLKLRGLAVTTTNETNPSLSNSNDFDAAVFKKNLNERQLELVRRVLTPNKDQTKQNNANSNSNSSNNTLTPAQYFQKTDQMNLTPPPPAWHGGQGKVTSGTNGNDNGQSNRTPGYLEHTESSASLPYGNSNYGNANVNYNAAANTNPNANNAAASNNWNNSVRLTNTLTSPKELLERASPFSPEDGNGNYFNQKVDGQANGNAGDDSFERLENLASSNNTNVFRSISPLRPSTTVFSPVDNGDNGYGSNNFSGMYNNKNNNNNNNNNNYQDVDALITNLLDTTGPGISELLLNFRSVPHQDQDGIEHLRVNTQPPRPGSAVSNLSTPTSVSNNGYNNGFAQNSALHFPPPPPYLSRNLSENSKVNQATILLNALKDKGNGGGVDGEENESFSMRGMKELEDVLSLGRDDYDDGDYEDGYDYEGGGGGGGGGGNGYEDVDHDNTDAAVNNDYGNDSDYGYPSLQNNIDNSLSNISTTPIIATRINPASSSNRNNNNNNTGEGKASNGGGVRIPGKLVGGRRLQSKLTQQHNGEGGLLSYEVKVKEEFGLWGKSKNANGKGGEKGNVNKMKNGSGRKGEKEVFGGDFLASRRVGNNK